MVIASYIWMKWYALLQFTASASYFIQQPFISFPAELFRNKFRHLINSWSDSGRNTGKKKNLSLCRFTLFKIIFHNKGAIGAALSQQRGRYSYFEGCPWFVDKLSLSLVQRNAKRTEGGFLSKVQLRVWNHSEGCTKLCSPPSNRATEISLYLLCLQIWCLV